MITENDLIIVCTYISIFKTFPDELVLVSTCHIPNVTCTKKNRTNIWKTFLQTIFLHKNFMQQCTFKMHLVRDPQVDELESFLVVISEQGRNVSIYGTQFHNDDNNISATEPEH